MNKLVIDELSKSWCNDLVRLYYAYEALALLYMVYRVHAS